MKLSLFPTAHADVGDLVSKVNEVIINPLIILLFAIAFVLFLWGALQVIVNPGSADAKEKASRHMLWGVIGMFIMASAFGIMRLIANSLGVDLR